MWKIPLFKIYWDKEDVNAAKNVIISGMNWATGKYIEEFEKRISEYLGVKYCVSFNSGTSALYSVLIAYGIKQGDEVIVPSFSFIATANAPLFVGAKPVFAEIEESTLGLDPKDVERKITNNTRVLLPIHYGGCPCRIKELKQIAKKNNLILIEDAAEAFGTRIGKRKVCTFGDAAILSFCQNKIITTGEGGAVVTNSKKIYEKLKLIRSHGRVENNYFYSGKSPNYITLGYNFRMSNITAALGVAQIKKINKIIEMRRTNAEYMTKKLSKIKDIKLPKAPDEYFHVYQMYTIRVKKELRNKLINYLAKKGIMTKIYFEPIHLSKFYRKKFGYKYGTLPITEKISREVLSLPMYPTLTKKEIAYITESIKEFFVEFIEKI